MNFQDFFKRDRNRMLLYMLVLVVLIAGFAFFQRGGEDSGVRPFFLNSDSSITILDQGGRRSVLRYDAMTEVRYEASADFGAPVTGALSNGWRQGLWHSDTLGDYTACAEEKLACAVVIRSADQTWLLSVESEAATRALYEALLKQMPQPESPADPA